MTSLPVFHISSSPIRCASSGHLTLSLDKESFETLGMEGKVSSFTHRRHSRFGMTHFLPVWISLMQVEQATPDSPLPACVLQLCRWI